MEKPMVGCRCGHSVMGKEILRTDLYERASGQEYVYVKFRCARCKRIAQTFVPASAWDWRKLEPAPGEMSSEERDRLLEEEPVEAGDLLLFHEDIARIETITQLAEALHLDELAQSPLSPSSSSSAEPARPRRRRTRGRRDKAHDKARAGARDSNAREKGKDKKELPDHNSPEHHSSECSGDGSAGPGEEAPH